MSDALVLGHRNPDTDSICSAVAYAWLKNATDPSRHWVAVRLGEGPAEIVWVFERFGVALPAVVADVRTRVGDVMTARPVCVTADDTLVTAGRLMTDRGVRTLPVVDGSGRPLGIVTASALAARYLADLEAPGFARRPISVRRLAEAVDGTIVIGDPDEELCAGVKIAASEPATVARLVGPGDVVVCGDRIRTQPLAIETGAACLVVTGGGAPVPAALEAAAERGAAIVTTTHDTYGASRLVDLAHAVSEVMEAQAVVVREDDLLAEVAAALLDSATRTAHVVDAEGRLCGIVSRTDLARAKPREVVLVDHNETGHSADGIEDARIVEVVDHHRIGDVQTPGPIPFFNLPVGATATVVAERFEELGVEIPRPMAGLLLAAILADTVLFKSPTTTDLDRAWAKRLGESAGEDPLAFGAELLKARAAATPFSVDAALGTDLKRFESAGLAIGIAQYETVNAGPVLEHAEELAKGLELLADSEGYGLALLLVTDVTAEGSHLMGVGATDVAERALGVEGLGAGPVWVPGLLSRKQQVAAPIVDEAARGGGR